MPTTRGLPLLLLALALLQSAASSSAPTLPVILADANFEHQTQAATGQTTGVWCVLLTASRSSDRHAESMQLWAKLAADEDKEVIYGLVDLDSSKQVARRFKGIQVPSAVLLRDRAMYVYSLPHDDDSAEIITAFVSGGYSQLPRQTVPPVSTGLLGGSDEDGARSKDDFNVLKLKLAIAVVALALGWKALLWIKAKQAADEQAAAPALQANPEPTAEAVDGSGTKVKAKADAKANKKEKATEAKPEAAQSGASAAKKGGSGKGKGKAE